MAPGAPVPARRGAGERVVWDLSKPRLASSIYENGAGVANLVRLPISGAKHAGQAQQQAQQQQQQA